MIRVRGLAVGLAATLALGVTLAARPADPTLADPPRQALRLRFLDARAREAIAALDAYAAALAPARESARRGAARVQSGDEPAAPALTDAAARLEAAAPEASAAVAALDLLRGVAAAVVPDRLIPAVAGPDELRGIVGQLADAADAADPVVARRIAAEQTLEHLAAALAALDRGDAEDALTSLADARDARRVLASWTPSPVTLPLWLRTTERLIDAAAAIARAVLDDDAEAVERAARRYASAAEDARRADVSLGLTLTEAGDGVTATPLRRLGTALAGIEEARAIVASVMLDRP
jgi:hypothetical protein